VFNFRDVTILSWEINANPKKVKVIELLQSPRTPKEIQKLIDMMTALSRFISNLDEHGMSLYKLL
jgi:hypothetical protein